MTTVSVNWTGDMVKASVSGHAGYAESGKDIVCSAVSILAFTLRRVFIGAVCDEMADSYEENVPLGTLEVQMRVYPKYKTLVKVKIEAVFTGFEILAENMPDYIKIAGKSDYRNIDK